MCGIVGFVRTRASGSPALEALIEDLTPTLTHRGPDAAGHWVDVDRGVGLGHRRLSIQDLSEAGRQPMASESGRFRIVFNGEIYGFTDLRDELERAGCRFRGHSDTEVLLAAIERWGLETALDRITGMFAFGLWDRRDARLSLVRDRLGEKPLYYGRTRSLLLFASELKPIQRAADGDGGLEIDPMALAGFLKHGYVPGPRSIHRGIRKLEPGALVEFDHAALTDGAGDHDPTPRRYWSLREVQARGARHPIQDGAEVLDAVESTLRHAVRQQLVADVPVGCFLSGGIDSTLVTALAQQEASEPIQTFTIGFEDQDFDESEAAQAVADHLGTRHHVTTVGTRDLLDLVPDLPTLYDEPFANAAQLPMYVVARTARDRVTVCLSGDGGDELFAGYNRYLWPARFAGWPRSAIVGLASLARLVPAGTVESLGRLLARSQRTRQANLRPKLEKLAAMRDHPRMLDYYGYLLSCWAHPPDIMVGDVTVPPGPEPPVDGAFLDQAMFIDQLGYLPDDGLTKVDRAAMGVSLETRLPLLSHALVELAWRIPAELKVRSGMTKWPLRELVYRHVPRTLIDRPKMGFTVPIGRWLAGDLRDWAESLLSPAALGASGLLEPKPIREAWRQHLAGEVDHANRLWAILMFQSWYAHGSGSD